MSDEGVPSRSGARRPPRRSVANSLTRQVEEARKAQRAAEARVAILEATLERERAQARDGRDKRTVMARRLKRLEEKLANLEGAAKAAEAAEARPTGGPDD